MIVINNILDAEKFMCDIDAAVFDLDDTLYSEKDYVRSGYEAVAKLFPQIASMSDKLWEVFLCGGKALDEVLSAEGLINHKDKALQQYRFHKPNIKLYDGVSEMLKHLRDSGKKIGIITDGRPEGQYAKINSLGLKVDEIIVTDELGGIEFRKPNETAFLIMQNKLKIPFKRMAYIGDNPKKDFIAPERLGMKTIYFKNLNGLYSI